MRIQVPTLAPCSLGLYLALRLLSGQRPSPFIVSGPHPATFSITSFALRNHSCQCLGTILDDEDRTRVSHVRGKCPPCCGIILASTSLIWGHTQQGQRQLPQNSWDMRSQDLSHQMHQFHDKSEHRERGGRTGLFLKTSQELWVETAQSAKVGQADYKWASRTK